MSSFSPDGAEPRFAAVSPLGRSSRTTVQLNERLPEPEGRRIGFLWDFVFRGDQIFELVQAELVARYPMMEFVSYTEFGNVHGEDERDVLARLPELLRTTKTDAVIAGVGA